MKEEITLQDKIIGGLLIIILVLVIIVGILVVTKKTESEEEISIATTLDTTEKIESSNEEYYVDIKGAVKKPGVYKVPANSIINDVIKVAGGLKSNAYTLNINLSQPIKESMVIYIYTKSEIKKTTSVVVTDTTCKTEIIEVNNCIDKTTTTNTTTTNTTTTENSKIININTASKEELMNLSGVGESKALAIIEYRKKEKFGKIEDIMNVSGIGESAFAKIKDYITV